MATFSKNGKRMGRPPKMPVAAPSAVAPLKFRNRYDAAGHGKRMAGWNPGSAGPNEVMQGLQRIRDRSRDSTINDWSGASANKQWASTLIGIGIIPRFHRIKSKTKRQRLMDLYEQFVREADADCVNNLYGLQTLAVKTWFAAGEVFARRRYRSERDGLAVPFQVQMLEPEMVPIDLNDDGTMVKAGNKIRMGVEFDRRGRRVAYWVYKEHPNDSSTPVMSADLYVRVPAEDMIHMFESNRPGQIRGVPEMAPTLMRLRNIADYEDVTLERQKIANLFVGFISRKLPQMDWSNPNAQSALAQLGFGDSDEGVLPLKPGLMQELDDGQEITFANPPEAGTGYGDYLRTNNLGTAAALGMPYELFSGDIREVSDRTLRVKINEFRRLAEQRQWQMVIPMFAQRIIDWFAEAVTLGGDFPLSDLDNIKRAEHAPHGWAYIHPVQDVQGKALEVEKGFRSTSSVISERGDDPEAVAEERKADMEREKAMGLWQDPLAKKKTADDKPDSSKRGDEDNIDNDEYSAPPNP